MPLIEIVLRFPDRDEVRLTDRSLAVGDTLSIDAREWTVRLEAEPVNHGASARFVCEPRTAPHRALSRLAADA